MIAAEDLSNVSLAIRDAVAPVFLITGIGSLMGVMTNRLGRAVDRFRPLKDMSKESMSPPLTVEMDTIASRIRWMRRSITLCTLSAVSVCLSIAVMFISEAFVMPLTQAVASLFIAAMVALTLGLLCFLREVVLATKEVLDS
jgi:membrane protein YqaA with SNARE-associated domain